MCGGSVNNYCGARDPKGFGGGGDPRGVGRQQANVSVVLAGHMHSWGLERHAVSADRVSL